MSPRQARINGKHRVVPQPSRAAVTAGRLVRSPQTAWQWVRQVWVPLAATGVALAILPLWLRQRPWQMPTDASRAALGHLVQASASLLGLIVVALTFSMDRAHRAEEIVRRWLREQRQLVEPYLPEYLEAAAASLQQHAKSGAKAAFAYTLESRLLLCFLTRASPVITVDPVTLLCRVRLGRDPEPAEVSKELGRLRHLATETEDHNLGHYVELVVEALELLRPDSLTWPPRKEEALREYDAFVLPALKRLDWVKRLTSGPAEVSILCLAVTLLVSSVGVSAVGNEGNALGWAGIVAPNILAGLSVLALVWLLHSLLE